MKTKQELEDFNSLKTKHTINYNGFVFELLGTHQYRYAQNSRFDYTIYMVIDGSNKIGRNINKFGIKEAMDCLIATNLKNAERSAYYAKELKPLETMPLTELLTNVNFRYARYQENFGGYYNLYVNDKYSPTGVALVQSCKVDVWEDVSKKTNQSHNCLSPTDGRRYIAY